MEEKNVVKASLKEISNKLEVSNAMVQSILHLSLISNKMVKIMKETQGKETTIVLEDDKVDIVWPIIHEVKQIVLEDLEIIDMVLPSHSGRKKVILKEDMTTKRK